MITYYDFLTEKTQIWGIPKALEDMTSEELEKVIDGHVFWINHMTKYASKTDQGFDDNRIRNMKDELRTMRTILAKKG